MTKNSLQEQRYILFTQLTIKNLSKLDIGIHVYNDKKIDYKPTVLDFKMIKI